MIRDKEEVRFRTNQFSARSNWGTDDQRPVIVPEPQHQPAPHIEGNRPVAFAFGHARQIQRKAANLADGCGHMNRLNVCEPCRRITKAFQLLNSHFISESQEQVAHWLGAVLQVPPGRQNPAALACEHQR